MAIMDLEVLGTISKNMVKRIKHQKDARRNSVQKEVLASSPSFFSASLVKKTLIRITGAPAQNKVAAIKNMTVQDRFQMLGRIRMAMG